MIKNIFFVFFLLSVTFSRSQDLDSLLNSQLDGETDYTVATFKATRIISCHSIERMQKGDLDFRIAHRFGAVNTGAHEFFGLDQSNNQLGLEYGFFDWLMAGVGRATYQKTYNGFFKISFLRQCKGQKNIPVSVSFFSGLYINSLKWQESDRVNYFSSRLSYVHQLLIARKFSPSFSAQLTPSLCHRNFTGNSEIPNDFFALGIGVRYKLTVRTSVNVEYFYIPDAPLAAFETYCPLSVGFDIETGGHVFQIQLTNSMNVTENTFLGETTGQWKNGDLHLGFNITRVFTIGGNKNKKQE
ncbi:MAG: hypothetical protein A2W91_03700 [Bacteroidetes bacterium GWF2_38_335]|nr:MAG: hypothetical protein A2W91_03700 [Bacteroidetes bacterium GWF2_38_335]OFY77412.1 MAG: hypothetical protein A2281_01060 [Bacteroidetes bacterium RIFOXYA12_FULL_38_20]HBS87300.1 hypothetical protein [Bacteroidales bacterium]